MSFTKTALGAGAGALIAYALSTNVSAQPGTPEPAGSDGSSGSSTNPIPIGSGSDVPAGSGSGSAVTTRSPATGSAAEPPSGELIEISDTAPAESASSVHLSLEDLQYRSRTQVSDILRQVPGLMVSQHAGGGKSDQYFIRGFDADHGTDIAIYADGIPVNMPSHGHGQGYADTHFLIPETIGVVDVHKGPYAARFGDFYTAGAMELTTIDKVAGPTIIVAGGLPLAGPKRFDSYNRRVVGMASPTIRDEDTDRSLIAVQIADTDGPFDNRQQFRQGNALVKWQGQVGRGDLKLETNWYAAKWNASGQVPESAVTSGVINRFGSLDPSEGGNTSRTSLQLGYSVHDANGATWRASAFALQYRLRLYSDFTLFARDPVHGDEIEQNDSRSTWGLDTAYDRHFDLAGMDTFLTLGMQVRNDDVENALWQAEKRVRLPACFDLGPNPCNDTLDRIREVAGYIEANLHVTPHVHVLPGIRFEQFSWDVDDLDPDTRSDPTATTGGTAGKAIALPKLSLEVEATSKLDLFVNAGEGFHSNDARSNAASGGNGALARAIGAEAGFRTTVFPHAKIAADAWYLHLASELVWSGDDGGTAASDPTRRYGVDLEVAYNPMRWLRLDANASFAHSTLVANAGNGNALALAPKIMGQGGATLVDGSQYVSLRARGIGDRPGNDANTLTAKGYLIFDLMAGRDFGKLGVNLTINNVLNTKWREAQFADESRITPTGELVEQMHYTPGVPLMATATVAYRF